MVGAGPSKSQGAVVFSPYYFCFGSIKHKGLRPRFNPHSSKRVGN